MSIAAHDGNIDTAPVGCYLPNEFGLYDMHGNVWEWCSDGYAANYYNLSPRDDPRGASGASNRVFRGGGFGSDWGYVRSAHRESNVPDYRDGSVGFRLARDQNAR